MSDDEPFLARWSRRKVEAREHPPAIPDAPAGIQPLPIAESTVPRAIENAEPRNRTDDSAPALPSLDSLRGLQSDYREFLKPDVDPGTQRAALKKLFSDPHFNQMDGLDVYIDDYGKFEPMSAAVSASLAANKYLRVVDHLLSEDPAKKAEAASTDAPRIEANTHGAGQSDGTTAAIELPGEAPATMEAEPPTSVPDTPDAPDTIENAALTAAGKGELASPKG